MGFFGGVGNACLTNIIICDILILLGYEFMKVSELIKLLQRNQCYLLEHGRELPTGTANKILKDAGLK